MDYLSPYTSAISSMPVPRVDPGTNAGGLGFWQQLAGAAARSAGAGGGLAGLASAFSPEFSAKYGANKPLQMTGGAAPMAGGTAADANSRAAQGMSSSLGRVAGAMGIASSF